MPTNTDASDVSALVAVHVLRLSTVTPAIVDVIAVGSVNKPVCGSVVMPTDCTINPAGFTQLSRRRGVVPKGAPVTLAQTVSPRLKTAFGVVQSAAKVEIDSLPLTTVLTTSVAGLSARRRVATGG